MTNEEIVKKLDAIYAQLKELYREAMQVPANECLETYKESARDGIWRAASQVLDASIEFGLGHPSQHEPESK